jgi:acyl-CoA synthetase (AMP-forming)/AMP-acid ligase II
VQRLRELRHPGLILFSSGSTGTSKGTVHDLSRLLQRGPQRRPRRTLTFNHIGGVNSLLDVLANAGCVVGVADRSPPAVCAAIEVHRVDVLPTTPTFLRLLLLSGAADRFDLSSLELITFGTEPMPDATLAALRERFPRVRFLQQYGLSEGGILRTHSRPDDPLWMRLEGDGLETRIVDGMLEVRSRTAMLGYLNAPDPFTADGWLRTGDSVVTDGEFVRILGRRSELINVGGEKVFPAEVEGVLEQMDGVIAATVTGEANAILGQIVVATVQLGGEESLADFKTRMRAFCASRLPRHKIPQKVRSTIEALHGERHKKVRLDSESL